MAKYHPTTLLVFRHHIRHAQILYVSVWNFIIRLTKDQRAGKVDRTFALPFFLWQWNRLQFQQFSCLTRHPPCQKFSSDGPSSWWKGFPSDLNMLLRCVWLYTNGFLLVVVFKFCVIAQYEMSFQVPRMHSTTQIVFFFQCIPIYFSYVFQQRLSKQFFSAWGFI